MKEKNILWTKKEECCACGACCSICPRSAIIMVIDEEGFYYPEINEKLCIKCNMCVKVCPLK